MTNVWKSRIFLHNVGFVHGSYFGTADSASVFKCKFSNSFRSIFSDEFDGLHDTVDNFMFNTRILTFSVFTNSHNIDVIIQCFVSIEYHILVLNYTFLLKKNVWNNNYPSILLHGLTLAYKLNCFLSWRFNDLCPLPIGVIKGPLRPIWFLFIELTASWGIPNFPSGPLNRIKHNVFIYYIRNT